MLQEENDIKDVVAASSSKPEFGFHSKIHQYLQTPPPTMPHQEMAPKAPPLLSIQTKYLEGLSPIMSVGWYHNPKSDPLSEPRDRASTGEPSYPIIVPDPATLVADSALT